MNRPKVTIVFPTYNEGATIAQVIKVAKKCKYADEILVVDGYSTDNTVSEAEKAGAKVVEQYKDQYPGKGIAIKTARDVAAGDVICFFDADVGNLKPEMLEALIEPVLFQGYDHTIANFVGRYGRVTELVVKPLFKIFFPEVKYNNPLAGEFCLKKSVLQQLVIPEDWGIETSFAIDITLKNFKSLEVDFEGAKKHDAKPTMDLVIMSRQILQTMFAKIIEYNRMIRGVDKIDKVPDDWIEKLKKDVAEKNDGIDKRLVKMKYDFCKMSDELYRLGDI